MTCNCYVSKLSDARRFGLRYGAHALSCPTYRKSGDEVDQQHDRDVRDAAKQRGEIAPYD